MKIKLAIYSFVAAVLLLGVGVLVDISQPQVSQLYAPVYSEYNLLESNWEQYKDRYIEQDTYRTLDRSQDDITTSEGQSYTMLRAVWMDDKRTFDGAWKWTKDILKKDDRWLFAWRFGERTDGTWGVLTDNGGNNSATDASVDIALALLLAHARWGDDSYRLEAGRVLDAIWTHEIIEIDGVPYLLANDVEKALDRDWLNINPSYYAPYAFRIFAQVDTTKNWNAVASSSYAVLNQSTDADFGTGPGELPPDWLQLNRTTGELRAPSSDSAYTTNYGYEALRIPWRVALDYRWFKSDTAKAYLDKLDFLEETYQQEGRLVSTYTHDGSPVTTYTSGAFYGASLGYFSINNPEIAKQIADDIYREYALSRNDRLIDPGYYSSNWIWFGLAFYYDLLPSYDAESIDPLPTGP